MTQEYRISDGKIDKHQTLNFSFNGATYQGHAGDTLASALLANGVKLVGRSFKYHRPRGIFSCGSEEPNALVTLNSGAHAEPNTRATTIELYDGLEAHSQNHMGSLKNDLLAFNDLLSPFLSAGFYYKTFMWPAAFWEKLYEPIIRRAAGLGALSGEADPETYDKGFLHCDVLVIGAGPTGLMSALTAGRAGASVIIADEDFLLGGRLHMEEMEIGGASSSDWAKSAVAELSSMPNVRVMPRTTGLWYYGEFTSKRSVLAAGATERSIAFGNNDRPGIMMAGAVRAYANRFGVGVGKQGRHALSSITLSNGETISTDCLAVSGGWSSNVHLTCHQRGKPEWNAEIASFVPGGVMPVGMVVAGAANGSMTLAGALKTGRDATHGVLTDLGIKAAKKALPKAEDEASSSAIFWHVESGKNRAWIDLQNDVTAKDVKQSHLEGYRSVEHLKRYTTLGMATDQGKTSNMLGLAVMADASGKTIPETGTTMFRPPYTPNNGAIFVEVGNWLRTQWYPKPGETHWRESVDREVLATRKSVGICDVTTLGKIDVQGRDAAEFLNKVYANAFGKLGVGKVRYGLMLREDGIAMDDGTAARMSETHFVVTTTTANAVNVYRHMEFCRQCLWPEMDVSLISTTEQWAQFAVAGPNALPTRFGNSMMATLMEEGKEFECVAYGTEALGVMRIEKGHAAGNELCGTSTALDLGLGRMVSKKKDCIGNTLSEREYLNREDCLNLVGFKPVNEAQPLKAGSHFVAKGNEVTMDNDEGWMTSVCYSPNLGYSIGLGFIERGSSRIGEKVVAADPLRGAASPLDGFSQDFGNVLVEELGDKALVSIAEPLGSKTKLRTAIKKSLGAAWPEIGKSTNSKKGYRLMGIQSDMAFAMFDHPGGLADTALKAALKDNAYCTDQSDAWCMIKVSGEGLYAALERICPLDLSKQAFEVGSVARTSMEHLGVVILKDDEDSFVLMGATSSAADLLHAVTVSVTNTQ
ncbi:Sarcosine oxidase subunit alpha [Nymphon striatum]|nr:Sarcosine oxidase subunit alpha [Nymphon striatum]